MNIRPEDLPTLRQHYSYFYLNERAIPIVYRAKSGFYYPYVAFDLVFDEVSMNCPNWKVLEKLPLVSMTLNERSFYEKLCSPMKFPETSKLILCSLIDQYLQLVDFLKENIAKNVDFNDGSKNFARFRIDVDRDVIHEIDISNSEATAKYNSVRSTQHPTIKSVTRKLCFDDEKFELSSIGGFLQLDRFIYPYVITPGGILLNLNDLRNPFHSTLNEFIGRFQTQTEDVLMHYSKIIQYGIRFIKKYKYYYQTIDNRFISLNDLLLSHRSLFFVQLFKSDKISLVNLHEHYRSDYLNLVTTNFNRCGYINKQPCVNGWSTFDSIDIYHNKRARLAKIHETLLINWLLIYDHKEVEVHQQTTELVLIEQPTEIINNQLKRIDHELLRKRVQMFNI